MERAAALEQAANAVIRCLGVRSHEGALIVCNPETRVVADALAWAADGWARRVELLEYATLTRHGEEPPEHVGEAMSRVPVILAPTYYSISHTQARLRATERGARVATLPMITEEIFERAIPVDYDELARLSRAIAARLSSASSCRITSAAGTNVVVSLEGRTGRADDGDLRRPGAFGNLPAGEGYIAPVETGGEGVVAFDGALAGWGLLERPLQATLAGGRIIEADGEAADWLLGTLDAGGETGRSIAELGIGTNPAARLGGNILEDEKVIGTVHLGFGTSAGIGGVNVSSVHVDGVLLRPTVEADGRPLLQDGVFVADL